MTNHFSIPKPCHEDWDKMTPKERGRFCGACQKVVRDFTQTTKEQFEQEAAVSTGELCGRVPAKWLKNLRYREPVWRSRAFARLRQFALCLMLVFGVQVLGLPAHAATTIQQNLTEWVTQSNMPDMPGPTKTLRGKIYDTYEEDPAAGAVVAIFINGDHFTTVLANDEGEFEIEIPSEKAKNAKILIEVSWVGRRFAESYAGNFDEVMVMGVTSDMIVMDDIPIIENRWNIFPVLTGVIGGRIVAPIHMRYDHGFTDGRFQQTIEDRIFMNFSDIKTDEF